MKILKKLFKKKESTVSKDVVKIETPKVIYGRYMGGVIRKKRYYQSIDYLRRNHSTTRKRTKCLANSIKN